MEAVVLCGIQATGKSTFCRDRFFASHVRVSMDMLKTRHREGLLVQACIEGKQPFVVDNTNPSREERSRYISAARSAGFRVVGYYFASRISEALQRNGQRPERERIPDVGVKGTSGRLQLPARSEGFDELYYVRLNDGGGFDVQEWRDEV